MKYEWRFAYNPDLIVVAKSLKMRWNPTDRCWWTEDAEVGVAIAGGNDKVIALAKARQDRQESAIALSRATKASVEIPCPDGLMYLPYQKAGIAYALDRSNVLIADDMGLGKGCVETTPVLTPHGEVAIGKLRVGDIVIGGSTGKAAHVTGVFPQGLKDVYRFIFNDGTSVVVDKDHLWNVRNDNDFRRHPDKWRTMSTADLLAVPLKKQWEIPFVAPVEFAPGADLPLHPYLLGVLLGNGSVLDTPKIHTRHPEQVELVRGMIPAGLVIHEPPPSDPCAYRITSGIMNGGHQVNALADILKSIDVWGKRDFEKKVPSLYLYASPEARLALLQGLLDTDGTVNGARVRFSSCSAVLAEQVAWLVRSLGGRASMGTIPARLPRSPRPNYTVVVQLPVGVDAFRLSYHCERLKPRKKRAAKKIVAIEPFGMANTVCISVDDPEKLYVVNDFIVTHNTIQGIGILNSDSTMKRVLVIAPATVKINWSLELKKWLVRDMTVGIAGDVFPDTDIVVINYDILKKWITQIHSIVWDLLIVDECHRLKNFKAMRTKFVLGYKEPIKAADTPKQKADKLAKNIPGIAARRKVFLTGTPIVNKPAELFPLLTALDPEGLGKNFFYFAQRYAGATQTRFGWDFSGHSNLEELNSRLRSTCMVRRLKSEVLKELPPKVRQVIVLARDGALNKIVKKEEQALASREVDLEDLFVSLELAKAGEEDEYLRLVSQLRVQQGLMMTELAALRRETALAKVPFVVEYVKELLEDEGTGKIIIFAHHHDVIDRYYDAFGDAAVKLDGRMSLKERQAAIVRFQNDDSCKVFIGGIQAAGVGITLTAANVVLFAELDWVPGNVTQAEDRAYRLGQLDSVLVQHLVVDGSIDAKMAQMIVAKQEVIDVALDAKVEAVHIKDDIIMPVERPSTAFVPKNEIERIAGKITGAAKALIDRALGILIGNDPDHAMARNDVGFNRIDGKLGHCLASIEQKTNKQYALGLKLCWKYNKTQLGQILSPLTDILKNK